MNQELQKIVQEIYNKKGFNILTLDVRGISSMTDYFVIAEGNVERHVLGIFRHLADSVGKPWHKEGESTGDWAVLDYGNIIVHLFTPDMREKYDIEKVWKSGSIVDVPVDSTKVNEDLYA